MKLKNNLMQSDIDCEITEALLTLAELAHWPNEDTIGNVNNMIDLGYMDAREEPDGDTRREKKKVVRMARDLFPIVIESLKE